MALSQKPQSTRNCIITFCLAPAPWLNAILILCHTMHALYCVHIYLYNIYIYIAKISWPVESISSSSKWHICRWVVSGYVACPFVKPVIVSRRAEVVITNSWDTIKCEKKREENQWMDLALAQYSSTAAFSNRFGRKFLPEKKRREKSKLLCCFCLEFSKGHTSPCVKWLAFKGFGFGSVLRCKIHECDQLE